MIVEIAAFEWGGSSSSFIIVYSSKCFADFCRKKGKYFQTTYGIAASLLLNQQKLLSLKSIIDRYN